MASLLDDWGAAVRASDTGDAVGALSPGGAGDGLLQGGATSAGIGFAPSDEDEGDASASRAAFLGLPPQPAQPDIFALDPVEREVTR